MIQRELGSLSPVLEWRLSDLLSAGLSPSLESKIEAVSATDVDRLTVEEELEANRERKTELQNQLGVLPGSGANAKQNSFGCDRL